MPKPVKLVTALVLFACGFVAQVDLSTSSSSRADSTDDWPQWRGPRRDGVSAETGLLKQWPRAGRRSRGRSKGAGEGYSSFSVADGRLFTLGARGSTEYVLAFDTATGKQLWEVAHGRRFSNDRGDGPRATPTIEGDRVYAFGASGDLSVLDAATGKVIWAQNVLQKYGGSNISWGLSESPLVLSDRILVIAGGRAPPSSRFARPMAPLIWKTQRRRARVLVRGAASSRRTQQAVFFTAGRALGVDVNDGRLLWSYNRVANRTANIATPIVRGNQVFLSSDYGTGAALLTMIAEGPKVNAREVYFTTEMRNHHASSVLIGDYLYGFSSSILTAMHFETGKVGLARSQRRQGLAGVCRRSALSLQRERRGRPRRGQSGGVSRARPVSASHRHAPDLEPSRGLGREAVPARSGHGLRLRRHGPEVAALRMG